MRPPERMTPINRGFTRRRIIILVVAVLFILLLLSAKGLATFYTDYLWFQSVHFAKTWWGVEAAKVGLALFFIVIFGVFCWLNMSLADRSRMDVTLVASKPEDELVQRYRATIGSRGKYLHVVVSALLGISAGAGASSQWNNWLLFRNSVNFTQKSCRIPGYGKVCVDAQFHKPIAFFVFKLPFIEFLISWAFFALIIVAVVTTAVHYLNGGIRLQGRGKHVSSAVKTHLSVLLAMMALVKAIGYYYQRFELDMSTRGFVEGASYTDVHAQLPAINLLMWISIVACLIFLLNIRRQGWILPATGIGLWIVLAIVIGAIYPALIQNFKVKPNQNALERPYIARDIAATRFAMGINKVHVIPFPYKSTLTTQEISQYSQSLSDAQLWDPQYALQTFDKLQDIRSYYQFNNLSVDRYPIGSNGQMTPSIIGVRAINDSEIPAPSWVNDHLQYTHGYGVALAPANQVTSTATPNFVISNLPPTSTAGFDITQPSIYFGVNMSGWVIANTKQPEIDYQLPNGNSQSSTYHGSGGVQLNSFLRRLAFAIRFGDVNTLISSLVTDKSRMIFVRDIQAEVEKAAPFLQYDADPYPVINNGGVYWVQDAYTTTNNFPYSQQPDTSAVNPNSGLANVAFNYVRNSVKVVINAYTGQMKFYVMDPRDPIIQAYSKAFPSMFTPLSKMPAGIRSHLRYPEDMMTVQASAYGSYHITSPANFYNQGDAWEISQDAGSGNPDAVLKSQQVVNSQGQIVVTGLQRMAPVYQELQLPGQSKPQFTIMEPMVPISANDGVQNLTSFLVGLSNPSDYGTLNAYVLPRGQTIDGPALVDATMAATPSISQAISLLNTQGSSVELGDVLPIPVGNTMVYVRPLYVESSRNPLPQLQRVIVVTGKTAAMDNSLQLALSDLLQGSVPSLAPNAPTGPSAQSGASPQVTQDLSQAQIQYQNAQQALSSGNLGQYQSDINQMDQDIQQAQQAAGGSSPPPTLLPSSASSTSSSSTSVPTALSGQSSLSGSALGLPSSNKSRLSRRRPALRSEALSSQVARKLKQLSLVG